MWHKIKKRIDLVYVIIFIILACNNFYIALSVLIFLLILNIERDEEKKYLSGEIPFGYLVLKNKEIIFADKKICEISLENIKNYPKISIEVKRKEIDNSDKITDNILIRNGILKKFTMTKNKKTVTIDKDGNWSYESPKLFINQTKNGNINYNLNDISKEEISNMDSLSEQYNIINEEVKKVKKLTKDIINN